MKKLLHHAMIPALLLAMAAPASFAGEAPSDGRMPGGSDKEGELSLSIDLALFDGIGLTDNVKAVMLGEAEAIFAGIGTSVNWLDRTVDPDRIGPSAVEVKVILSPVHPSTWDLKPNALGIVLAPHWDTVFVFARTVARTIGLGKTARSSDVIARRPDLALAMARVLVHEVIHTIARDHEHAEVGIMRGSQSYRTLIVEDAWLDERCAQAFAQGLIALNP